MKQGFENNTLGSKEGKISKNETNAHFYKTEILNQAIDKFSQAQETVGIQLEKLEVSGGFSIRSNIKVQFALRHQLKAALEARTLNFTPKHILNFIF